MQKQKTQEIQVQIEKIQPRTIKVKIKGTSTLICHKFSDAQKQAMLDKQMKKGSKGREAKNPKKLFEESLYPVPGTKKQYGFPASGFKKAMVSACRNVEGFPMTLAKGAFYIMGDIIPIKGDLRMREDIVRLGTARNKPADIRYRGEFVDWEAILPIKFNPAVISPEQVMSLLSVAGFAVGVGDWRPETNGSHGMFEVAANV